MSGNTFLPWRNGYYKLSSNSRIVFVINGENVKVEKVIGMFDDSMQPFGTWKFGDFGKASDEIVDHSGKTNYNIDIELWGAMWKTKGVVGDDGTKITIWNNQLDYFEWLSNEEYNALKEAGEPADSPSHPYKMQPHVKGRFLWISGPPGSGKSTTGLHLSRKAGYVYYEGDSFPGHVNPYILPNVNDISMSIQEQKPLKDVPKDRVDAIDKGIPDFMKLIKGQEYNKENVKGFYYALCRNVIKERNRIGGDWVITHAVPTRYLRDYIKDQLGPELSFLVLNMSKKDQMKRLISRHGSEGKRHAELLNSSHDVFEPAMPDERNVFDCRISSDMSPDAVVEQIINIIE